MPTRRDDRHALFTAGDDWSVASDVWKAEQSLRRNVRPIGPTHGAQFRIEEQLSERVVILGDLGEDRALQEPLGATTCMGGELREQDTR